MNVPPRLRRPILRCSLCLPEGLYVELDPTTRPFAAAMDHALDEHREELLFDFEATLDEIRVCT